MNDAAEAAKEYWRGKERSENTSEREQELLERLREAEEVLGFYADTQNWAADSRVDCSTDAFFLEIYKDESEIDGDMFGGKRAREYFEKHKESAP